MCCSSYHEALRRDFLCLILKVMTDQLWEVKCFDTEPIVYTSRIKNWVLYVGTFLEEVLYICSYREVEQELILKQSKLVSGFMFTRNSDVSDVSDEFYFLPMLPMRKITFKDYKQALQAHYEAVKINDITGILLEPTPAQMRQLSSLKNEEGLGNADEEVMRAFFETNKDDSLKLSIRRCNIDKFKPIIQFLKAERDTENRTRVELAAILIDFTPRPYSKFAGLVNQNPELNSPKSDIETVKPKNRLSKKVMYLLLGLIGVLSIGYVVKDKFLREKQCMQWQYDHYEEVDCLNEAEALFNLPKEPLKKEILGLKKIDVCDTTLFFENGKAKVFYCKVKGVPEYFNGSGYHPTENKPLRPITAYIIKKYVKKCE